MLHEKCLSTPIVASVSSWSARASSSPSVWSRTEQGICSNATCVAEPLLGMASLQDKALVAGSVWIGILSPQTHHERIAFIQHGLFRIVSATTPSNYSKKLRCHTIRCRVTALRVPNPRKSRSCTRFAVNAMGQLHSCCTRW